MHRSGRLSPRAIFRRGRIDRVQSRLDRAEEEFRQVSAAFPRDRLTLQRLGEPAKIKSDAVAPEQRKNHLAVAEDYYRQILVIDPEDVGGHYNLMIVYQKPGRRDEAKKEASIFKDLKDDPSVTSIASDFLQTNLERRQRIFAVSHARFAAVRRQSRKNKLSGAAFRINRGARRRRQPRTGTNEHEIILRKSFVKFRACSRLKKMLYNSAKLLIVSVFLFFAASAQTPTPSPAAAGKSYDAGEIKRPGSAAPQYPSPVTFADITAQTKINFKHNASPTAVKYLPETMSAGVAMFDFDNDGRMDLFFTNGAQMVESMPKGKQPEKVDPKFWNRLYRQNADGTFEDATEKSNLKGDGYSFGAAIGDFDRDGFADLFVTKYGGANLFHNNHDGTFTDVTKKLNVNVDGWATSAGFFDYDRDGRLDLFVARYVDWDFEKGAIFCGDTRPGYRSYCHPDNFKSSTSMLFHQKADGTFEDASVKSGVAQTKGKALGVAFADFDDDGWTDVFVANDNIDQQLFRNKRNGTFEESALVAGVAFDEKGKRFAGMGVDAGDFDGDGKQDVVVTAFSGETYPLYRNVGDLVFDYVTQSSGIGQISILGTGWGIKFIDADNDGRRDIFVVQSHVSDVIEKTTTFLKYKQTPLLIRNTEKGFQNVSLAAGAVFSQDFAARGMACGDIDNDGDTDIVIAQTDGAPVILRNNGTKNHWLGIDLRGGVGSAPGGEGSRVVVTDANDKRQVFDVSGAGSYLSANDSRIVVGLGETTSVKSIEIRWTSGKIQILENPSIDRYQTIKEK